jgi:hypothetical protein
VRVSLGQIEGGENGEVIEGDEVECMIANMIYKVCVRMCLSAFVRGIELIVGG